MKIQNISLNQLWEFAYVNTLEIGDEIHSYNSHNYETHMPIPGYWDDYLQELKRTKAWSREVYFNPKSRKIELPLGAGKPEDASLPYLVGAGWYRKYIFIPDNWVDCIIKLHVEGFVMDAAVYINESLVELHQDHMTGFCIDIQKHIKFGQENKIEIAVSNVRRDVMSCIIRGYKGQSGGIYGNVFLHVAEKCAISDVFVRTDKTLSNLMFNIETTKTNEELKKFLVWNFKDEQQNIIHSGVWEGYGSKIEFNALLGNLLLWSDTAPNLYSLQIELRMNEELCDIWESKVGIRYMSASTTQILLNDKSVFLRGLTEHAYFPLTCTPPFPKEYYRFAVSHCKSIGFNWIRFHTTTPSEAYLSACDELGMMVQVETANGFTEKMWIDILHKCRKHPSVVLYCCGNEVYLDDDMMVKVEKMALHCKGLVPDALFSPMQALGLVDWHVEEDCQTIQETPFLHNPEKLNRLKSFSDVLQPQKSVVGVDIIDTYWQELETKILYYQKPYMSHEVGILDSYIDLDLENRYKHTRIGSDLFSEARRMMKNEGILHNAKRYYKNACLWSACLRKIMLERLRMCDGVAGYDYLGAIDCHWHRTGYSTGILNEFHENKPGETNNDILKYNGENIIVVDAGVKRNYYCEEEINMDVFTSIYGEFHEAEAKLIWHLVGEDQKVYVKGEIDVCNIEAGKKTRLGTINFMTPKFCKPKHCVLHIIFSGSHYLLNNEYDFWVFPQVTINENSIAICEKIDDNEIQKIYNGQNTIIVTQNLFSCLPISFNKMMAGRTVGNTATVLYDHPILQGFPHEGWCDLQWYPLMEGGASVVFDETTPIAFEPIIEVVSSYKLIFKQASLFEFYVGKGRVIVCTLNLLGGDPAQQTLLSQIINYIKSDLFATKQCITKEQMIEFANCKKQNLDFDQGKGLDANAKIKV